MDEKKYKPLDTSNKKPTSNLFEFETLVDMDLSSILFLMSKNPDKNLIKPEIYTQVSSINVFRNLLLYRENRNPLSILIKDEYNDSIDSIYKELLDTYKKEIVDKSEMTTLFKFLIVSSGTNGLISNTVICKDSIEKNFISSLNTNIHIVDHEDDMKNYDSLFVKYSTSLITYKNLLKKHIYLFNARYNMMKQVNIFKPEVMLLSEKNIINVVDPYKGLTIPTEDIEKWLQILQEDTDK